MHYPLFWNIGYPGQLLRRSQQSNVCPEQGIPGRAALSGARVCDRSVTRSRFLAQTRSEKGRRIWNSHVAAGHRPNATNFHSILDGEGTEKRRLNLEGIVSFSPDI